jgi:uncharacterized protein (DUF885 family)
MLNRRQLLILSAATYLSVASTRRAWGGNPLNALLAAHAEQLLRESPEQATMLGLDAGSRADLKSRLDDRSQAAMESDHSECLARLKALAAFDRDTLKGNDAINYEAAVYANQLGVEAARFAYGTNTLVAIINESVSPYVVSQETGAFSSVPEFLNSQHKIRNGGDADAYLARLEAFSSVLDQETERIRADAARGVMPPEFILATTLNEMSEFRAQAPGDSPLVASIASRAAAGASGEYARRAARIVERRVYPALDRQIAALGENRVRAAHDAGVWRLPEGEAYYHWMLKVGTTTELRPDEVHQLGEEQIETISTRMDGLLKARGLTKGTVSERMKALREDPSNLFPDSDAGRAALIDYLNARIAAVRTLMPTLSRLDLRAPVVVERIPPATELGAPLAYMSAGALDGSRPSTYYINLRRMADWPRFVLPTLTYHETIPGHVWQGAFVTERHTLPLFNTMLGFNAYVEGWALYAEQLADEIGLYDDDPLGRLGYLQLQLLRACRLVADTGLHSRRWSRERAVSWLVEATGHPAQAITSEVDRYCVIPGQACGYKVGQREMLRLREKAKMSLGSRFDLRDFDDVVVSAGTVPLTVLARAVDAYIARTRTVR